MLTPNFEGGRELRYRSVTTPSEITASLKEGFAKLRAKCGILCTEALPSGIYLVVAKLSFV